MTELKTRDHRDVTVVEVPARFRGNAAEDLSIRVTRCIAQGRPNLVLDLARCTSMDSRGLGIIVACYRSCRNAGGDLKLLGPFTKFIRRKLELTKLDTVFELFESETKAVQSF